MPEKRLSMDEAFVECFKASLDYCIESDRIYTEFLNNQIKFHEKLVKMKAQEEPMKIFKKAHKKWENELDELEKQLCDSYEKLGKEFSDQQEFYHKLKEQ